MSRRCVSFFEEKPTSSSVPVLRSELNLAVEKTDKLHKLSSVYLEKSVPRRPLCQNAAPIFDHPPFIGVFHRRLKTVEVLIRSLNEVERQVRKYESRLSEEDMVPADTAAIQGLRDQLGVRLRRTDGGVTAATNTLRFHVSMFFFEQKWEEELSQQDAVFQALQSVVRQAKEAGSQLSRLHPDRSPELELYQERANQMTDRWSAVRRQMETR